jgi:hypothetical protein
MYFFITTIVTALIIGSVSSVWFLIGGIIDSRRLFRDLEKRIANPLDDGRVEGHVSLSDKARFKELDKQNHSQKVLNLSGDMKQMKPTPGTVNETLGH